MRIPRRPALSALFVILSCPIVTASAADGPKRAVLFVEDTGTFEVLYSRAESSATGAAFFGLIGYGIEESARNSNDSEREEHILQYIDDSGCDTVTVEALRGRLLEKGFEVEVRHEKAGGAPGDAYAIRVDMAACGFKMIDTTRDETSAFFAAEYEVLRPGQKRGKKKDEMIVTGDEKVPWGRFESDGELASTEFEAVRIKAGRRLANKLIYLKD